MASLKCTNTGLISVAGDEKGKVTNSPGAHGEPWNAYVCVCVLWSESSPQRRGIWALTIQRPELKSAEVTERGICYNSWSTFMEKRIKYYKKNL